MKRQDKVTRYSIKKYSVGVASVAVAAFIFFAGGEAQAADTNATTPETTAVETGAPSSEGATSATEKEAPEATTATEEKPVATPAASEETPKAEDKAATVASETPSGNKEATTVDGTETPDSAPTNSTENKEEVSTLAAEDDVTASNEETPTLANVSENTNSNLIKGTEFNGEYGVNVSFRGKDGKEYTTTYGGASLVNLEKIDTTSPITATFTLKNGDKDINANVILAVPNYWALGNSSLVFDGSNIDKEKGVSINSSLGNDYSSLLRYGNTNGEYKTLQEYKNLYGDAIFNEQLRAVRLEGGQIKANDIVTFTLNMKLKEQDVKDTPAQSVTFSIYNFINGHNGYATDNLNITFLHDEDVNTGILLDKQVLPTYRPSNGQDGGVLWEYARDIQQYMPTPDKMFRYGRVDNNTLPEDKLVSEKTEAGYYFVTSGDERLKGFPNLSNYTFLLIDEAQKNISTHGYTANPERIKEGFYRYEPERSENFVLNGINLDAEEEAGAKILHFQVIPSIILKEDQTYTVGKTNEATWDPKTMVKQFTDPNVIKWLVAENDSNQLDKSKLTVKITDISDENEPKDVSSLSLKKAGKYKVEYSYVFKDSSGADLPISNTGYVTVLTGKQKLVFNFVDKNDPAKEVTLASNTVEGDSGAVVNSGLKSRIDDVIANYVSQGYKLAGTYEIPSNFDNTANTVDGVDNEEQIVNINFVHDVEEKKEYSDAEREITYVGAGKSTPNKVVTQEANIFVKTSNIDKVTKEVIGTPTINGSYTFAAVNTPSIKGYTADKLEAGAGVATFENPKIEETVTYTKNPDIKIDDSKDVTRTIIVTLPDGTTNKVEQKVTFTRVNTQDPVTDDITPGAWNVEKQTLPAYAPKDYTGFTTKVEGSVAEVEVTPSTENLTATISYESNPTVTNEVIPFKTKYEEDATLDFGETTEAVEGKVGTKKITISYKFENGDSVANEPTEEVVVAPTDRVIKVGTKPTVSSKDVDFATEYEADSTLDFGTTKEKVAGVKGVDTTTTTYKLVGDHAEANEPTTARTTEPTNRVVVVGTKPTSVITKQDYKTTYEADDTLAYGERKVKELGELGVTTVVTTYTVDEKTGQVTPHEQTPQVVAPKDEVVAVGTKPTSVTKELPYKTTYKENPSLELNEQKVLVEGKKGSEVTTTTYSLNTTTGVVTPSTKVDRVEAIDEVIEVGTKVKEDKHTYSYNFVSTSEGRTLPKEVLNLVPQGGQYDATVALLPELPAKLEVEVEDGKWTFVGYTPSEVLDFEDVVFVGEWKFVQKQKPIEPTKPTRPTKPEMPEKPTVPSKDENNNKETLPKVQKVSAVKEGKKLPNTTATNTSLPYASLGVLALAAAALKRRKNK